jgi:hypothetical protein
MAGPGKPGRAKGHPKTGGRQKGAVDKIKREAILAAQGITPLDYLMMLVRAETEPGLDPVVAKARETLRFEAAKAAAPYVHARLQAVTLGGDPENPIKVDSMSELEAARRLAFLLTKGTADAA